MELPNRFSALAHTDLCHLTQCKSQGKSCSRKTAGQTLLGLVCMYQNLQESQALFQVWKKAGMAVIGSLT